MKEEEKDKTLFTKVHDGLKEYHNRVGKLPSREYVPTVCVGQLLLALKQQGLKIVEDKI
jgi:hypothetical protein